MASTGTDILCRLAQMADELREASLAADLRQLVAKTNEGRFFVACVGQFKRGKSTLLNALVGEQILPTGVLPVTSVPTVLRYGDSLSARVLVDSEWRTIKLEGLPSYVSEDLNPENAKRVAGVETFVPCPLLASGMCLVDTPGIGSVFAGNTETTKEFIPQIDAAIMLVGADPPITGEELDLLEAAAANVDEVIVVLNKIDRVSLAERQAASSFIRKVIQARLKKQIRHIYEVSALNRVRRFNGADDWDDLLADLTCLAAGSGNSLVRSAAVRGARRFSNSLLRSIAARIQALQEPLANSEERIAALRRTVGEAEQALRDVGALLSAEQLRLSNLLLARRKDFLREVTPVAMEELAKESVSITSSFGPRRRRELMAIAQTVAHRHVVPWLCTEETQAQEVYAAATLRFVSLVNGLLQRLADLQPAQLSHLPSALDAEPALQVRSRFYFHDMIFTASPASPLLYVGDVLLGAAHVNQPFRKAAENFLEQLLATNASRVQGDVEQRVVESRRHLESEVRRLLREVCTSSEQALLEARELMSVGTCAVQEELERLEKLRSELRSLPVS